MTRADQHYRRLWFELGKLYLEMLGGLAMRGQFAPDTAWDALQHLFETILRWSDITAAARLRWVGVRERTILPPVLEIDDVLDRNPWLRLHAEDSDPLIKWRAEKMREAEQNFLAKRAVSRMAQTMPREQVFTPAVATYRLERFRRDTVGEIVNASEQIELAVPQISEAFPYAEYLTREDARVRPTHAAMHRFVALRTWKDWPIIRPKVGYNCRCYLAFRTRAQAIERGWMSGIGSPLFEAKWPNSASEKNFRERAFPDAGWFGPKFWSFPETTPMPVVRSRVA